MESEQRNVVNAFPDGPDRLEHSSGIPRQDLLLHITVHWEGRDHAPS